MIVWPYQTMPNRFLVDGYAETFPDARLFLPMDRGPSKVRRASSAAPRPIQGRLRFDDEQKMRFSAFWDEDTKGGSLPFLFPAQSPGFQVVASAIVAANVSSFMSEFQPNWWIVMFAQTPPTLTRNEGRWLHTISLIVMP